jgi:VCBS repeat-containing protein
MKPLRAFMSFINIKSAEAAPPARPADLRYPFRKLIKTGAARLALAALLLLPAAGRADSLQIQYAAPKVVLSWSSTNSVLQSAFNVNGPWAYAAEGAGPYSVVPMATQQFFRLAFLPGGATNPVPTVVNQYYSMQHDGILEVFPPGVLTDDLAVDSNVLTASLYEAPLNGTVTLSTDGSFLYEPNAGFTGTDTFTYVALDNLLSSVAATVSIAVTDTPPVVVNDQFGILMNTTGGSAAPGVLRHATYLAGDVLTVTLQSTTVNGTLALHTDGSFEYTPNTGFLGDDQFTYTASSGGSTSGVAVVTLVVHGAGQPPVAYPTNYTMAHDQTLAVGAPGLLNDAADPNLDPLTAALVTGPANGSVILMPDGSFTYVPTNGFAGTDTFTWEALDGVTNSTPATVTILVTNGIPTAMADTFYVSPNTIYTNVAPGVLANDTDPEGDSLTAVLVTPPGSGTLTLATNGGFVYQPTGGFTGTDSFTYEANNGLASSAPAVVTLVVSNRPPVAQPDSYALIVNEVLTVTAPGVLANDTDPAGNPLSASLVSSPAHGSLALDADGSLVYTPAAGYTGTDRFTYAATDGSATSGPVAVTLTVLTNALAPLGVADFYTTRPNTALTTDVYNGVLANDLDVNNCHLTAVLVAGASHGTLSLNADGTFVYLPAGGFTGMDSFVYEAFNGASNSEPVTVSLTVTDTPPVSVADSYATHSTNVLTVYAPGILENDYDPNDGDNITALLVSGPRHGTLSLDPSGEFTYQATNGFLGVDDFTYQATDGIVTGAVTQVSITVGNQQPVAGNDAETTSAGTALALPAPGVLAFSYDGDDDPLTAVLIAGPANAASFSLNADGSYSYTPAPGFTGTDSFTYAANDGLTNSAPATVTITVTGAQSQARVKPEGLPATPTELDLQAIAFTGGTPVAADTVRPLIGGPPQWLDSGDGIINPFLGEHSYPYSYVRGSTLLARAVFHTPNRNAFRAANGRYKSVGLRGRVIANGVALPNQIVTPIRFFGLVPDRVGTGGTTYVDVASAVPFTGVVGVVNLRIIWEYTVNNGATWIRCAPPNTPAMAAAGTSWHKIYLTWSTPLTWPLFETEVAVGSINGAGQVLPGVLLNRIWNEFRNQRATRVDGTPMTYYHDWNVPTLGGVPDLLRFADGRCGQWAQFFIGCLQAQGMAPFNMRPSGVYTVPDPLRANLPNNFCSPVFMPFMVANWNFGVPGIAEPNYPANLNIIQPRFGDPGFPFENIMILNPFDQFPPFCANVLQPFGQWGFQWLVAPQVDYVGGNGANKGQNNPLPRSLFTDHAIVNYAGVYFDPSYGTIYLNSQDMQNQAISGICYPTWAQDLWDQSGVFAGPFIPLPPYPVLHIRPTPIWTPPMIYICN